MAGAGGGAWKVAYADFVTAMMAFFLVMWITAQSKEVKEAVAHYFNEPNVGPTDPAANKTFRPSRPAAETHKSGIELPDPKIILSPGSAARRAPPTKPNLAVLHDGNKPVDGAVVLFEEGSAELNAEGKEQLNRLVPLLAGKRFKIEIRGHATHRPLPKGSPYRDAWGLCYARSAAVMKHMEEQGIESDRFRLSQAGPYEPFTLRVEVAKRGQNSRVEVCPLNDVVEDLVGNRQERDALKRSPRAARDTKHRAVHSPPAAGGEYTSDDH